MRVGVPAEVTSGEFRVAITPAGVLELTRAGHQVLIQAGAGTGSSLPDEDFAAAGASVLHSADDVWGEAELVLKVKGPAAGECHRLRPGLVLFSYLNLAASGDSTQELLASRVTAVGYETVRRRGGSLPLLAPMSEVAGRMAVPIGAHYRQRGALHSQRGGRGVLLGAVAGGRAATVTVLGAGTGGRSAAATALGLQAEVVLLDADEARLRAAGAFLAGPGVRGRLRTAVAEAGAVERAVLGADLVIGAVLEPGARSPVLVSRELAARMRPGAVVVDLSVDQGGCFADSRPTSHGDPVYQVGDTVFHCVANLPGVVPHTSTYALTAATLPYAVAIANRGWREALRDDDALAAGLNAHDGILTCAPVAHAHQLPYTEAEKVLTDGPRRRAAGRVG
jgi:alanine dehydrogenase